MGAPKRSETGLKPFETVGKRLYLLILLLLTMAGMELGGPLAEAGIHLPG